MNRRQVVGMATVLGLTPAIAALGDKAVVEAMYARFFSAGGAPDIAAVGEQLMAPTFESIGDFAGNPKRRDDLIRQIQGFHKLVPDLKWEPQEIIEVGNRFVVRSRATGTPKGPLFGVDGKGKSFTLMSIDIHEVAGGQIVRVYHVEDWAGAMRQLAAQ